MTLKNINNNSLIAISPNSRYFVNQDGSPFFWLGDTLWELIRLYSIVDARLVLENRKSKGFSAIQIMITGVGDGTKPNLFNQKSWIDNDPAKPNENYFKHVDSIVNLGREMGLIFVLGIYHQLQVNLITTEKARNYARWISERYKDFPNIIWTMYPKAENEFIPALQELAAGIREGDNGSHLITVHPDPAATSSSFIHNESWLDFNMIQTCVNYELIYKMVNYDYNLTPTKPTVMAEGGYEGVEFNKQQGALEIRKQAYWSHLAGGHHSYGHNDNWVAPQSWRDWIDSPGSFNLKTYRDIITSCPEWWNWIPDQKIFAAGAGSGLKLNTAARSGSGDWILAYISNKRTVSIKMDKITSGSEIDAYWINPVDGVKTLIGRFNKAGNQDFTTPDGWEDAVLYLRAV